jgi:hypothetical protein
MLSEPTAVLPPKDEVQNRLNGLKVDASSAQPPPKTSLALATREFQENFKNFHGDTRVLT